VAGHPAGPPRHSIFASRQALLRKMGVRRALGVSTALALAALSLLALAAVLPTLRVGRRHVLAGRSSASSGLEQQAAALSALGQGAGADDIPVGSLADQLVGDGAAGAVLASAVHDLDASKRRMLASQMKAAKVRQQTIRHSVSQHTARLRRWRQEQQATYEHMQRMAALETQRRKGIAALGKTGELGSWLAADDHAVPAGDAQTDNAVLSVWRDDDRSIRPRGSRRGRKKHGTPVAGVADLPDNWFMGGVALSGAEWRRRLGDAVVEANLRTDGKVRKLQALVGSTSDVRFAFPRPSCLDASSWAGSERACSSAPCALPCQACDLLTVCFVWASQFLPCVSRPEMFFFSVGAACALALVLALAPGTRPSSSSPLPPPPSLIAAPASLARVRILNMRGTRACSLSVSTEAVRVRVRGRGSQRES
jgi:hypothetical protein